MFRDPGEDSLLLCWLYWVPLFILSDSITIFEFMFSFIEAAFSHFNPSHCILSLKIVFLIVRLQNIWTLNHVENIRLPMKCATWKRLPWFSGEEILCSLLLLLNCEDVLFIPWRNTIVSQQRHSTRQGTVNPPRLGNIGLGLTGFFPFSRHQWQ